MWVPDCGRLAENSIDRNERQRPTDMTKKEAQKQAEAAKKKGNEYFKKEKLGAAIDAYTEAITLCPEVPVYWTNRALCERKRNEWEKVEADCRKALELDNKSVKGHYFLGLALLHYQQYGRAVAELEKALDLGRGETNGNYMVEEIWQELAKARYTQWEEDAHSRRQQLHDLQTFLQNLMRSENQKKLREIISVMVSTTTGNPADTDSSPPPAPDQSKQRAVDGNPEDETKIRYPEIHGSGFYPPVYEENEGSPHSSTEDSTTEEAEGLEKEDDKSVEPEVRDAPEEHHAPKARADRRRSFQIRLRKFMDSGYFESDGVAEGLSVIQHKEEPDEKVPYSIYDVYKVFKELVKLQQGEAGKELLRTTELYERRSKALNEVFKKLAAPDIPDEDPDYLCCSITMEIFRDPVMTPSGISYERAALEEHLRTVGNFDPVSRIPLTRDQVYPNLALRNAVQAYLADHGWAYKT
ncbi:hypothetical protein R1sor_019245 [Riccia sorocarpa]|uniref:E3 ubiquitin-protein ligase CHIP n=1 Tax=Riccia sorocarpa TaxID=122646 RepID=A0ABD3IC29_9MARC